MLPENMQRAMVKEAEARKAARPASRDYPLTINFANTPQRVAT